MMKQHAYVCIQNITERGPIIWERLSHPQVLQSCKTNNYILNSYFVKKKIMVSPLTLFKTFI